MADEVRYPLHLRTIARARKNRSQPAAFSVSQPRRGKPYRQEIGTDAPVIWEVNFRFTRAEALVFRLFFEVSINRGVDPFVLPIDTEFGLLDHTVEFLPDSLLDLQQDGEVFTYSASILSRAAVFPDGYLEAGELIVMLPAWTSWASLLDSSVTAEMPAS